jgi:glycosyltransferase involved in cell wall biosynthesis
MSGTRPKITIVMPSYNQVRFLEQAVSSVLAQRKAIHEFFVMDGGSQDGSVDVIRRYAGQLDYWASERDGGQADAVDRGFRQATGDVLYWINSDDILLPGAVECALEAFERTGAGVVSGWDVVIDEMGRILQVRLPPGQTLFAARWGILHVSQPTCFFRRDLYLDVGGLDRRWHGVLDTDLWLRMLKKAPRWAHMRRLVAAFRLHSGQKGQATLPKILEEHRVLASKYPEYAMAGPRALVGIALYRAGQCLSGRYVRERVWGRRLRGRDVFEAFGDSLIES